MRRLLHNKSKHDIFYTRQDDIKTFIECKKPSFKPPILHLYSKNDNNKTYFTSQNEKKDVFTQYNINKITF